MIKLLSSVFLGWSLGSNHSGNAFGTAVASKAIRYGNAVILCSLFIILGAYLGGKNGMLTISKLVNQNINTAFITTLSAAITVTIMTIMKMPISTSQAIVGAIIGIGISSFEENDFSGLSKIFIVWVCTPIGAIIISFILYYIFKKILDILPINIFTRDYIIKIGLIISGCYASYALGANNAANVTGVYANIGIISITAALFIAGFSIALGVITYSKKIMISVGGNLVELDTFSAFISVLSHAIILDIFSRIGVPTSSSQAIIGAIIGIGILKGVQTINIKTILSIFTSWIISPIIAFTFSFLFYKIYIY